MSNTNTLKGLQPETVWNHFAALNAVPRPSKKEEKVRAFLRSWFKERNISFREDAVGNLLATKPASPGMENAIPVVLQAHVDMVCQQNEGTDHRFEEEGIDMFVDGDWVRARGTTLGADNGIGVAFALSLLENQNAVHPPLEALFTVDEETGMTGALGLKKGWVQGTFLLNIDTEDDQELTVGCAGGVDVTSTGTYTSSPVPQGYKGLWVRLKGLTGGHSGMDIHLGRGNANLLLSRVLRSLEESACIMLSSWEGGSLRNAIPREGKAHLAIADSHLDQAIAELNRLAQELQAEYAETDPGLCLEWESIDAPTQVLDAVLQQKLIRAVEAAPAGILRMSPTIPGLVQTSNNVSKISAKEGIVSIQCLTRSAVDSEKMAAAEALRSVFSLAGLATEFAGSYPGWTPAPAGSLASHMRDTYVRMFQKEPHVNACHAGLECGIIGERCPGMEMISFGPTITGAHSPDERVSISSVQKSYDYFLEVLRTIPTR